VWLTEEVVHKLSGRRHYVVSRRAEYWQGTLAVSKPGRKDQGREVATVIDMKMAEEKNVDRRHLCSTLPEAESAASSCVNDHTRSTVVPY
jgi:hypothetical protein